MTERPAERSPKPAYVEIVQRVPFEQLGDRIEAGYLVPNEVRINGIPIAIPRAEDTILVHALPVGAEGLGGDLVKVTITMFARAVRLGFEHIES